MWKRAMVAAVVGVFAGAAAAGGVAGDDEAKELLGKIRGMPAPNYDRAREGDAAYMKSFDAEAQAWQERQNVLIAEFWKRFPERPEAMGLMEQRWTGLLRAGATTQVAEEAAEALPGTKAGHDRTEVLMVRAMAELPGADREAAKGAVRAFIAAAPKDDRGGTLLVNLAAGETDGQARQDLYAEVVQGYPRTQVAKVAAGKLRQAEQMAGPFELEFTDAVTGEAVSLQRDMKGKVVVVVFWARWSEGSAAELAKWQGLYEKYRGQGVAFVGVSLDLDSAGTKPLGQYVTEQGVTWPQYGQGQGWLSTFSTGWGINELPTTFVVDGKGNLYSVSAAGKEEEVIKAALGR